MHSSATNQVSAIVCRSVGQCWTWQSSSSKCIPSDWDVEAFRGQLHHSATPAQLLGVSLRFAVSVERHRCLRADSLCFQLLGLRCCKHPQDREIDIKIPLAVVAISLAKVWSDTPQIFLVSAPEHYSSSLGKGKRDLHTLSISWTLSPVFPVLPFFLIDLTVSERRRMDNNLLHRDFLDTYKMPHRFLPGFWT